MGSRGSGEIFCAQKSLLTVFENYPKPFHIKFFLAYFATKITKLKNETFFGDFPTLFRGPTFFARNLHASRGELVQGRMASHYSKTKSFVHH